MEQHEYLVVLVTVPELAPARALARALVDERLAACVQVIPGGTAVYRWQGVTHVDDMCQLIIKTRAAAWPRLQQRIRELHEDEVPEILALPLAAGLPAYLGWMDQEMQ